MAESPTSSPSISSISPAKTPATNQKNILNFFRVTTPTPPAKRENSEPKATPKKPQLPPKAKKNMDVKNSPVVAPEVFVLEDSPVKAKPEIIAVDPPLPPATELVEVAASSLLESDATPDEMPVLQADVVLAEPMTPSDEVPSVDLTASVESETNNDQGDCQGSLEQKEETVSKKRSRKKTQKYSDDQHREDPASHSAESLPLSPEVVERLNNCQQKATSTVQSLLLDHSVLIASLETCQRGELAKIKSDIGKLLELPSDSGHVSLSESMEVLSGSLRRFTQYFVQDRTCTLPELLCALKADLDLLRDATALSSHDLAEQIQTLLKPYDTAEYLKEFARRVSYGYRSNAEIKETSLFDDQSELALWRWELTVLPDDFPHAEDIKTAKTDFTRVGKAVRAILKVSSEITKSARATGTVSSQDEVKINALEDKVTAAMGEIQKANERKAVQLKKKLAQEAEAEKRMKRKEELAAAKAAKVTEDESTKKRPSSEPTADSSEKTDEVKGGEVPASRKKPKPLGEKELKELATIEKQKSMLMNFFSSPTSKSKKSVDPSTQPVQARSDAAALVPPSTAPIPATVAPVAAPSQLSCAVDLSQFLTTPLSMSEIVLANKERYGKAQGLRYHKPHRKPISLSVTVTAPQADSAFDSSPNNYAEIKDVLIDSRKRLLSFAEDYRPAYFGTFSKRSRLVSGRRPFAKDPLLNYDYDSEAEWEEEDPEGEDIALSDNEEDGEGDEIVYDDFFRPDNEIDDPDGDADVVAPSAAGHHHRMTVNGVRFIGADVRPRAIAAGSGEAVEVASADADSEILLNYSSVVHPFFVDSDRPVPRLLSVGVPSRLASLGIPLHNRDATGVEHCKDLKDSRQFKETMLPTLALFVHGKKEGADKLVDAFIETLHSAESPVPPKAQIKKRILELAERKKSSGSGESGPGEAPEKDLATGPARWRVHGEAAAKLGLELPPIEASLPQKQKKRAKLLKAPAVTSSAGDETATLAPSVTTADKSAAVEDPPRSEAGAPAAPSDSAKVSLLQFFQPQPAQAPQPRETERGSVAETVDMTTDPEPATPRAVNPTPCPSSSSSS